MKQLSNSAYRSASERRSKARATLKLHPSRECAKRNSSLPPYGARRTRSDATFFVHFITYAHASNAFDEKMGKKEKREKNAHRADCCLPPISPLSANQMMGENADSRASRSNGRKKADVMEIYFFFSGILFCLGSLFLLSPGSNWNANSH